jgi:hypothetical protein
MSARWRTSDVTVLGVAGAGIVLVTVAAFLATPPDLAPRENGSSFAAHPNGGKAAFLLLKELDYDVQRSYEPAAALARVPEKTALVIANPTRTPSQQDVRALKAFLERGGMVLATGRSRRHSCRECQWCLTRRGRGNERRAPTAPRSQPVDSGGSEHRHVVRRDEAAARVSAMCQFMERPTSQRSSQVDSGTVERSGGQAPNRSST